MKNPAGLPHALRPPRKLLPAMRLPPVQRDAPILPPLRRECVRLKRRLRRRATAPGQIKQLTLAPHIRTRAAHAKRNIAHQRHAACVGIPAHRVPLLVRNPLDVTVELPAVLKLRILRPCLSRLLFLFSPLRRLFLNPISEFFRRAIAMTDTFLAVT